MTDFARMRRTMVDNQLLPGNVIDRRILAAMGEVPRELFVPESRRTLAYIDDGHVFPDTAPPRVLSAPAPFARLIQLAEIRPSDRVLDIGAATGYSSAVLARLGADVMGIERDGALAARAAETLAALGIGNARVLQGAHDHPPAGAFDVIVRDEVVEAVPPALLDALAEGGRFVGFVLRNKVPVAHVFVRSGETVTARADFDAGLAVLDRPGREDRFVF